MPKIIEGGAPVASENTAALEAEAAANAEMVARAQNDGELPASHTQQNQDKGRQTGEVDVNPYEDEFIAFADEFDNDESTAIDDQRQQAEEEVVETPEPAPEPTVKEEELKPEEVDQEKPDETPAPVEETPTEEEVAEVEIPEVPPEPIDTRTPEEVQKALEEARAKAQVELEQAFRMTEEEEEQFQHNPGDVLSKMAAKLYLDIFNSLMQGVKTQLPSMVTSLMQQDSARKANQRKFYSAWPQLAKAEYLPTIERIANNYRVMNPQAKEADAIREIGAQAWVALRLPLEELAQIASKPTTPVVTPAQEVPTLPANVHRMPASAGNTTQSAKAPVKPALNEFEQLAEELILDDDI